MKQFASQITFLNFQDFQKGKYFASQILQLQEIYNIGWAVVYGISGKAFLGIVDHSGDRETEKEKTSTLISLTTDNIDGWYSHIGKFLEVSPIREIPDAGLKSFFFTGPEGHQFEIQQFLPDTLKLLFS